jgi:hypothetical protein
MSKTLKIKRKDGKTILIKKVKRRRLRPWRIASEVKKNSKI